MKTIEKYFAISVSLEGGKFSGVYVKRTPCDKWNFLSLDINECDPNPCLHKGVCLDKINAFKCICKLGYTGDICETSEYDYMTC